MSYHSTVLSELLKVLPRHEFEASARQHHRGRRLRSIGRWDQFLALAVGQLTGRTSLRDLVANLHAQARKLYHVGARTVSRSSLSRVNRTQPASLFEEIFHRLLSRTQRQAPHHRFRFKAKLFTLDASLIRVTASVFPWARYRATKGAIKLHVGLDHAGHLPAFVTVSEGKKYELSWARNLDLPAGSVVVFDRGFHDAAFFKRLETKKIRFVTRLKRDISFRVLERRSVLKAKGLTSDQTILFDGPAGQRHGQRLRRVGYRDPKTQKHYVFLTNDFALAATTIAEIYHQRWQIELFFKWIKQNLQIKAFLGVSRNAVLSQIWVALAVYLLLAYLKFLTRANWTLTQILRLLQLNLFERRNLLQLLEPSKPPPQDHNQQLSLRLPETLVGQQ